MNVLEGKFGPNFEYLGVDASKILVSVAKKDFPNRNFRAGDMRNLRTVPEIREGEKFDAVFAVASFHHLLTEEDRRKALDEFASVLAPNGMLLMTNWNLLSASNLAKYGKRRDSSGVFHIPFSGKPRTYFALEPTVLSRELAQSGWEVLESIENERNLTTIARFLG